MRQEDMIHNPSFYQLGKFVVHHIPYFYGLYSRYIITANGVEVRSQISKPGVEDAWTGYWARRYDKELTTSELEQLIRFKETSV